MKYLHTMVRVADIEASLKFYRDALGLEVLSRRDNEGGQFTLVFLAAPGDSTAQVELTHNWPKADGSADKSEVFADGFLDPDTGLYRGRPVDVAVMKDGSLLISDDFAGAIYRVSYSAP